jgi:leader peptidase (prepilin peptidase) / N-methyltransferase
VFLLTAGAAGAALGLPLTWIARTLLRQPRRFSAWAYAGVTAATAAVLLLIAAKFGLSWQSPAYVYLTGAAVVLGIVDLAEKRLPNAVIYPSLVLMPVLLTGAAAITGDWTALLGAGLGAAGLFAVYFLLALISPGSIGMGDVKLAAVLGLALGFQGWSTVLIGSAAGFVVGGLVSLIALVAGRATLHSSIPFGPAMLAGAFLGLLAA